MKIGSAAEPALGPRWAARELGFEQLADQAAARAEFLRRLPEAEWVPPASWPIAVEVLNGYAQPAGTTPAREEALNSHERRLREEVDALTWGFFQMPINQRRQQWQALYVRCQDHPALAAWLRHLETGLAVATEDLPKAPSPAGVLAEALCDLFVLRPAARAARRRMILSKLSRPMKQWQQAACTLERDQPALTALDPPLMERVVAPEKDPAPARVRTRLSNERYQPARAAAGSSTVDNVLSGLNFFRYGWVLLVVMGAVVRIAMLGCDSGSNRSQAPVIPTRSFSQPYAVPDVQPFNPNQPGQRPGEATRRLFGDEKARRPWEDPQKPRVIPSPVPRPGEVPRRLGDPPGVPRPGQPMPPSRPSVIPDLTPKRP